MESGINFRYKKNKKKTTSKVKTLIFHYKLKKKDFKESFLQIDKNFWNFVDLTVKKAVL